MSQQPVSISIRPCRFVSCPTTTSSGPRSRLCRHSGFMHPSALSLEGPWQACADGLEYLTTARGQIVSTAVSCSRVLHEARFQEGQSGISREGQDRSPRNHCYGRVEGRLTGRSEVRISRFGRDGLPKCMDTGAGSCILQLPVQEIESSLQQTLLNLSSSSRCHVYVLPSPWQHPHSEVFESGSAGTLCLASKGCGNFLPGHFATRDVNACDDRL